MSDNFNFFNTTTYYVFEKDNFYIAIPYYSNGTYFYNNFNFIIEQGFNYFDVDINFTPLQIYANNPIEAIEKAKKISEREINKLKAEINRLRSEKEFSFKEGDEYKVFGVTPETPKGEIEKIYRDISKIFHPDKNEIPSSYMMVIINQAWNIIKRKK